MNPLLWLLVASAALGPRSNVFLAGPELGWKYTAHMHSTHYYIPSLSLSLILPRAHHLSASSRWRCLSPFSDEVTEIPGSSPSTTDSWCSSQVPRRCHFPQGHSPSLIGSGFSQLDPLLGISRVDICLSHQLGALDQEVGRSDGGPACDESTARSELTLG